MGNKQLEDRVDGEVKKGKGRLTALILILLAALGFGIYDSNCIQRKIARYNSNKRISAIDTEMKKRFPQNDLKPSKSNIFDNYNQIHSILINGDKYDAEEKDIPYIKNRHWINITEVYKYLKSMGLEDKDITILNNVADFKDELNKDITDHITENFDVEKSTETNIKKALDRAKSKYNENDLLVIYMTGYGRMVNGEGAFLSCGDEITESELLEYIDGIKANMLFILENCKSGNLAKAIAKKPNVAAVAACSEGELASGIRYGSFGRLFISYLSAGKSIEEAFSLAKKEYELYLNKTHKIRLTTSKIPETPVLYKN